jgi:hypothetical protein
MSKEYKLVVVTPAGRKRYMEVLLPYILREKDFIDEYRIWVNTKDPEDLKYFEELENKYPGFVTLDRSADNERRKGKSEAIHCFFKNTIDVDTIYIRLDDDIIWLDNNFFKKIYKFRVENPEPFLIFGNIINNAICDHIHQKEGIYEQTPLFGYDCLDENGWKNPQLAEMKHRTFLTNYANNDIDKYKFNRWIANDYERISINAICWFGKELKKINGNVAIAEEEFLSKDYPRQISAPNCIYGDALCVHFSFYTQREHLDQTDILELYQQLFDKKDNYSKTDEDNYFLDIESITKKTQSPIIIIVNGTVKIINSNN